MSTPSPQQATEMVLDELHRYEERWHEQARRMVTAGVLVPVARAVFLEAIVEVSARSVGSAQHAAAMRDWHASRLDHWLTTPLASEG